MKRRSFLQLLGIVPLATISAKEEEVVLDAIKTNTNSLVSDKEWTLEECTRILKEEWGDDFYENVMIAQMAVREFGLGDYTEESNCGNNPETIKIFYEVGKAMRIHLPYPAFHRLPQRQPHPNQADPRLQDRPCKASRVRTLRYSDVVDR